MMKKVKTARYKEIFQELLPDSKGFINKETIYKSELGLQVRSIIKPLLDELEQFEEKLNFQDFCNAMEMLMKSVNQGDKAILFKTNKKRQNPEELDSKFTKGPKRNSSTSSIYTKNYAEELLKISPFKSRKSSFLEDLSNS